MLETGPKGTAARRSRRGGPRRRGLSSLDYVLILAVTLPTIAFFLTKGKLGILLVYEMLCVLVSWPFM
jgi:hypothetical protein